MKTPKRQLLAAARAGRGGEPASAEKSGTMPNVLAAVCFGALGCLFPVGANAADPGSLDTCAPVSLGRATVARAAEATVLALEDGRFVRLESVAVYDPTGAPALHRAVQSRVNALVAGRQVEIRTQDPKPDRYGRLVAQVKTSDAQSLWLQDVLVREGMVLVDTAPSHRSCARQLLLSEAEARSSGRGLWAMDPKPVLSARDAETVFDRMVLVEGTVLSAKTAGATTYLNFGPVWRTDFTVTVRARSLRLLRKEGLDPLALEGERVRVRGYAQDRNGSQVELTHPEQIEILSATTRASQ